MKRWQEPDFEEIRMDAEINCYASLLEARDRTARAQLALDRAPRTDRDTSS